MATSGVPSSTEQAGRRLGVWSLLMVPAVLLSLVVANLVGYGIMQVMGMADTETFYDQGFVGWLVVLLLTVIICVPQGVGLVLGMRARALGVSTLGLVGIIINAIVLGFWLSVLVVNAIAG